MKPEKAIEILQERIDLIKQDYPAVKDLAEYLEALEVAVKALKNRFQKRFYTKMSDMTVIMTKICTPVYVHRANCILLNFQITM